MTVSDIAKLLQQARAGDQQALGDLLNHHRSYLHLLAQRYLDRRLQSRVAPSDIVQQTLLEAQRDLMGFRGENSREFAAWIRNILQHNVHETLDRHLGAQKRAVSRERVLGEGTDATLGIETLPGDQSSPSQRAMRGEWAVLLSQAIDSLPESQREAIRLRHLEGLSLKELAGRLQRSEMAAAGLLKRGLRALRKWFQDRQLISN